MKPLFSCNCVSSIILVTYPPFPIIIPDILKRSPHFLDEFVAFFVRVKRHESFADRGFDLRTSRRISAESDAEYRIHFPKRVFRIVAVAVAVVVISTNVQQPRGVIHAAARQRLEDLGVIDVVDGQLGEAARQLETPHHRLGLCQVDVGRGA